VIVEITDDPEKFAAVVDADESFEVVVNVDLENVDRSKTQSW